MPLIDNEVRAAFPGLSDAEIEQFYNVAKSTPEEVRTIITGTDLGLAIISQELGWQALKDFLVGCTGDSNLSAVDIQSIANASRYLRLNDDSKLYAAIYGSASEISNKRTASNRKKGLNSLLDEIKSYTRIEDF